MFNFRISGYSFLKYFDVMQIAQLASACGKVVLCEPDAGFKSGSCISYVPATKDLIGGAALRLLGRSFTFGISWGKSGFP